MYTYENYLLDAIETVSAWDDLPESEFGNAVTDQARLLAGIQPDEYWHVDSETPIQ